MATLKRLARGAGIAVATMLVFDFVLLCMMAFSSRPADAGTLSRIGLGLVFFTALVAAPVAVPLQCLTLFVIERVSRTLLPLDAAAAGSVAGSLVAFFALLHYAPALTTAWAVPGVALGACGGMAAAAFWTMRRRTDNSMTA